MSYGGSSTIMAFLAIGLVMNVHMRRSLTHPEGGQGRRRVGRASVRLGGGAAR